MDSETKDAIEELREDFRKSRDANRFLRKRIADLTAQVVCLRQDNELLRAQGLTTALIADECKVMGLDGLAISKLVASVVVKKEAWDRFSNDLVPELSERTRKRLDERVKEKARRRGVELVMADGMGD